MTQGWIAMRTRRWALGHLLVLLTLCSCSSAPVAWRPVDPSQQMITIVGRLEALDIPSKGEVRLEVTPDSTHRFALAPGQKKLVCIVHANDRDSLTSQLLNLTVGRMVTVSGRWVAREEPGGIRHYLNSTTDIVPHD